MFFLIIIHVILNSAGGCMGKGTRVSISCGKRSIRRRVLIRDAYVEHARCLPRKLKHGSRKESASSRVSNLMRHRDSWKAFRVAYVMQPRARLMRKGSSFSSKRVGAPLSRSEKGTLQSCAPSCVSGGTESLPSPNVVFLFFSGVL